MMITNGCLRNSKYNVHLLNFFCVFRQKIKLNQMVFMFYVSVLESFTRMLCILVELGYLPKMEM